MSHFLKSSFTQPQHLLSVASALGWYSLPAKICCAFQSVRNFVKKTIKRILWAYKDNLQMLHEWPHNYRYNYYNCYYYYHRTCNSHWRFAGWLCHSWQYNRGKQWTVTDSLQRCSSMVQLLQAHAGTPDSQHVITITTHLHCLHSPTLSITFWKEFLIGTVLYKTKSLDGTKPNTNPKTNPNSNTNRIQLFYAFFEHRPMIFKPVSFVRFTHRSNTVFLPTFANLTLAS